MYQKAETVVLQALETPDGDGNSGNGPNVLDKERNLMNEDPKWQGQLIVFCANNPLETKIKHYMIYHFVLIIHYCL